MFHVLFSNQSVHRITTTALLYYLLNAHTSKCSGPIMKTEQTSFAVRYLPMAEALGRWSSYQCQSEN